MLLRLLPASHSHGPGGEVRGGFHYDLARVAIGTGMKMKEALKGEGHLEW